METALIPAEKYDLKSIVPMDNDGLKDLVKDIKAGRVRHLEIRY